MKKIEWILLLLVLVGMFASCSSAKFLEEGEYLLNKNKVECTDDRVDDSMLSEYIKQKPNTRWVRNLWCMTARWPSARVTN